MNIYCFVCRSVTAAQRAVSILKHSGIPGGIVKMPQEHLSSGCGYAVKITSRSAMKASEILISSGLEIIAVYMGSDMSELYEVKL